MCTCFCKRVCALGVFDDVDVRACVYVFIFAYMSLSFWFICLCDFGCECLCAFGFFFYVFVPVCMSIYRCVCLGCVYGGVYINVWAYMCLYVVCVRVVCWR